MKKCKTKDKTCPFLYEYDCAWYRCSLDYEININNRVWDELNPASSICKLEVVQWATDKSNSETFIPDENRNSKT